MRSDEHDPALEFLKQRFAAGDIDAEQFERATARVMGASSEAELAEAVRSVPSPVALTAPHRRLERPLEINGGMGRLRLGGRWQVARETHVSAQIGGVVLDLTDAQFDDRVVDLHVYTGWGAITIIVPRGAEVQIMRHRGNVDVRLDAPVVPGLQLIRLDATTNIGRIHLVHPDSPRAQRIRRKAGR